MTTFRFRLQRVLEYRQTQLELEEVTLRQQAAALAELDRGRAGLEAAGVQAERQVRQGAELDGADLAALAAFRASLRRRAQELAARRAECAGLIAQQRGAVTEARRRCRLLERMRERRLAEWNAAYDRELETTAAESYLAQWARRL